MSRVEKRNGLASFGLEAGELRARAKQALAWLLLMLAYGAAMHAAVRRQRDALGDDADDRKATRQR